MFCPVFPFIFLNPGFGKYIFFDINKCTSFIKKSLIICYIAKNLYLQNQVFSMSKHFFLSNDVEAKKKEIMSIIICCYYRKKIIK